jgi:hypothetical protein
MPRRPPSLETQLDLEWQHHCDGPTDLPKEVRDELSAQLALFRNRHLLKMTHFIPTM